MPRPRMKTACGCTETLDHLEEADEIPEALSGSLQKESFARRSADRKTSFQNRHVSIEKGWMYWSLDDGSAGAGTSPNFLGGVDLSNPCEVLPDSGQTFILRPLGQCWLQGDFKGAKTGRVFVFDAEGSSHTRRRWLEAFKAHIQFAAKRPATAPMMYSWMWGDAGRFFGHGFARLNPARWSKWRSRAATIMDFEAQRNADTLSRPVEVKFGVGKDESFRFSCLDEAIEHFKGIANEAVDSSIGCSVPDLHGELPPSPTNGGGALGDKLGLSNYAMEHRKASGASVLLDQADGYPCVRVFAMPQAGATLVGEIPSETVVEFLAFSGEFLNVRWKQLEGWVGRKHAPNFNSEISQDPEVSESDDMRITDSLVDKAAKTTSLLQIPAQPYGASPPMGVFPESMGTPSTTEGASAHASYAWPSSPPSPVAASQRISAEVGEFANDQHSQCGLVPVPAPPVAPDAMSPKTLKICNDVVAAMSASGAGPGEISLPTPCGWNIRLNLETPSLGPAQSPGGRSPADSIEEAQSLIASMLTPTSERRGRSKNRPRSASGAKIDESTPTTHQRRAASCQTQGKGMPQLQPLNGCMPDFPHKA